MKKLGALTLFICLTFLASSVYAQATYALIIGVADYQNSNIKDLKYADKDALAFKQMLTSKSGGFVPEENIKCFINDSATSSNIFSTFSWVENAPKSGDRMIIYFSGHGDAIDPEQVFLLTYDANGSDPNLYNNTAINMHAVKNKVKRLIQQKHVEVILITDACRTNEETGDVVALYSFESIMNRDYGEIKLNSCSQNQKSLEDPRWGKHGVFTYYLLQGWMGMANANDDNQITAGELFRYVTTKVTKATYDHGLKKTMQVPSSCCSQHEDVVISTIDSETLRRLKEIEDQIVVPDDVFLYATAKSGNDGYDEDTVIMEIYNQLVGAIADDRILVPKDDCAYFYYSELKKKAAGKPIFYDGESELLAVLSAKGQEVLVSYLNGAVENINSSIFKTAYEQMAVGLNILSKEDFYYSNFKSKALFLESQYLMFRNATRELALAKIDSAISLQPTGSYLYYSKGLIYNKYLMYDSAMANFDKAILLAPQWYAPYSQKSTILLELGKINDAISCMNQMVRQREKAHNYSVLGDFYSQIDSLDHAIRCYQIAIEKDSTLFDAYVGLFSAHRFMGNLSLSYEYYDKAFLIDPENKVFLSMDARYYEKTKDYAQAYEKYLKVFSLDTTQLFYFVKAAEMRFKKGERDEALADLGTAISLDPFCISTYYTVIQLLEDEERYEGSIQYNKYLMSFYPGYNPADLYVPFMKLEMMDSAEYYLQLGEKKFPNNKHTMGYRAYDLLMREKYEDAISLYEKLMDQGTTVFEIYGNLAFAYYATKNESKCLFYSRKTMEIDRYNFTNYQYHVTYLIGFKQPTDSIAYYICRPYELFQLQSEDYLQFAVQQLAYCKKWNKLMEYSTLGVELYPSAYQFYLYKAIAFYQLNEKKLFYSWFQKAVDLEMPCFTTLALEDYLPDPAKDKKYLKMSMKPCQ